MRLVVMFAALGLVLSASGAARAEVRHLSIKRLDDTTIDVYVDAPSRDVLSPVLLSFQGSQCVALGPEGRGELPPIDLPGAVRVSLEKPGATPADAGRKDAPCPAAYLQKNTIDARVMDALTVVAWLRAQAPWWNHRLYVTGASEGATIAAIVGALSPETHGMVLLNGSIGRPFGDGWADAMAASAKTPEEAKTYRAEAARTWDKARATPTVETAFGDTNTLKWWASIIDLRPANLLLLSPAPILVLQSEKDEMTPPVSATMLIETFRAAGRTNLTVEMLPGLDHGLRDAAGVPRWDPTIARMSRWLQGQERQASAAR